MSQVYQSFSELVLNTTKDQDYHLDIHQPSQEMAIVAIHGGAIEPLTGQVAAAIAGEQYSRYILEGQRHSDNEALRIPVVRFDEMRLRSLLQRSLAAIAIDGVAADAPVIHLGGSNRALLAQVRQQLTDAGFTLDRLTLAGPAHDPGRFYNWPKRGGLLLELSQGLRQSLVDGPLETTWQDESAQNARFVALTEALQAAIANYVTQALSDLDETLAEFERATETIPRSIRSSRGHHDHQNDKQD